LIVGRFGDAAPGVAVDMGPLTVGGVQHVQDAVFEATRQDAHSHQFAIRRKPENNPME